MFIQHTLTHRPFHCRSGNGAKKNTAQWLGNLHRQIVSPLTTLYMIDNPTNTYVIVIPPSPPIPRFPTQSPMRLLLLGMHLFGCSPTTILRLFIENVGHLNVAAKSPCLMLIHAREMSLIHLISFKPPQ